MWRTQAHFSWLAHGGTGAQIRRDCVILVTLRVARNNDHIGVPDRRKHKRRIHCAVVFRSMHW